MNAVFFSQKDAIIMRASYSAKKQALNQPAKDAWFEKIRIYDLYSDQIVPIDQEIRPGSAIVIPEKRYLYFDQWITLSATVVSAVVSVMYFYVAIGK